MRESQIRNLMDFKERRIGLELENQIIDQQGKPITAQRMQRIWQEFADAGWEVCTDPALKTIIGADKQFDGFDVHLSSDAAAGNLEMAFSPAQNLDEAERILYLVHQDVFQVLKNQEVALISIGMQPGKIDHVDKYRAQDTLYKAAHKCGISTYFNNGLNTAISAHQAGVSIKLNEAIIITNELIKVTGLIVALCANSSIHNWKILPWQEWRILVWDFRLISDKAGSEKLCGFPDRPFTSIADYLKYYWSTSTTMLPPIREQGWIVPDEPINFLQYFVADQIAAHDLVGNTVTLKPVAKDLNLAMILMWPFAKPHLVADPEKMSIQDFFTAYQQDALEKYLEDKLVNCYIENRIPAAAPVGEEMAIPALTLGLVNNISGLQELTRCFTWDQWRELVYMTATNGLEVELESVEIIDLAQDLIHVAAVGLKNRRLGEEKYLSALQHRIDKRENPAQRTNRIFQKKGKAGLLEHIRYS